LGEQFDFSKEDRGVYYISINSKHIASHARFVNLGKGFVFEGVRAKENTDRSLAKTSGALAAAITCSKAGYSTQVYQLQDGTTQTIDFTKLTLVPLFDQATVLETENITETSSAIITRFSDRGRDRHAREDQFHLYDHYLKLYWENRTATIQITDYVAKGGTKIRVDQWTLWPLDKTAREFRAFYRGIGTVAEYHNNTGSITLLH
jgi:hypothetical protein